MTIRHLECALAVARAGSINNAARKLLVSQPYLSGMINSLERELGYPLFVRSSHGITCTTQGIMFMEHAENILAELDKIQAIATDREQPLRIATYYSRFITEHFFEFHNRSKDGPNDRYREMGNMEVIDAVAGRDYSLGIIYHAKSKRRKFTSLADKNNLEYHQLFENMGAHIIMGPGHPLAGRETLTEEDLASSAYVFYDDESTMLYIMDHLRVHASVDHFSVSDRGAFTDALLSGRYISVINTPFPEDEKLYILKDIPESLASSRDIDVSSGYVVRKDHRLTGREEAFLHSLVQHTW